MQMNRLSFKSHQRVQVQGFHPLPQPISPLLISFSQLCGRIADLGSPIGASTLVVGLDDQSFLSRFMKRALKSCACTKHYWEVKGSERYSQAGTPIVKVTSFYNAESRTFSLKFSQTVPPTPGQTVKEPMFILVAAGLLDSSSKDMPLSSNKN
ncbi:putative cytosol alanyl aminopeptidase [Helianthus annuus]|nr:putative cytosol alanyl aminopeptidase [Helianthus annuus]